MKRLVPISVILLTVLLLTVVPLAVNAQAEAASIYVVQPGDTSVIIAGRYCMTVQELTVLNGVAVSGTAQLTAGTQIRVVNRCGGGSGGGGNPGWGSNCGNFGVFDRGPRVHAMGSVYGNMYVVVLGDTSFSIGQRFGISAEALGRANGINPWRIWAGQRLVIPGLGGNPCPQPCYNCPVPLPTIIIPVPITPYPTVAPPVLPRIGITSPAENATLPPTFTVTGTGQGLFEGSLVVRAINNAGDVLVQQPVTLQGPNVGTGGPGTFSVQLTVNVSQPTPGFIVAFAPQTPTAPPVSVRVTFSPGGSGTVTYRQYSGNQCQVTTIVNRPYFAAVGGTPQGTFGAAAPYWAFMGAKLNNQLWFLIGPIPATNSVVWAPATSVSNPSQGCAW